MQELTFGQFKSMDYPNGLSFEYVLVDLLFKKQLNVNEILTAYSSAIEKENHINKMRFKEACVNLGQILSGNFTTEEQQSTMMKHAVHTYNMSDTMPSHVFDKQYNYTEEDEINWNEHCNRAYGFGINK